MVTGELDVSVDHREQRVVLADADVEPGVELGAALAHQDVAGAHVFAAEALDPEALRVRLAVVPGRRLALFVRHASLLSLDAGDADARDRVAVPAPLAVVV